MKPLGKPNKHYWRVIRMADATDVNLVKAMAETRLTVQEWAGMVEACRSCDWVDKCDRLLASAPKLTDAPEQCANCFRFANLKASE